MPRRLKPEDYEYNADFAEDLSGVVLGDEGTERFYDCSLCLEGKHDLCQEYEHVFCKCFLEDHEEEI